MLHLGGVLGGTEHQHVLVFAGNGHGDLAFQVEMILPADAHRSTQPVGGPRDRRFGVAAPHPLRRQHELVLLQRLVHRENRR